MEKSLPGYVSMYRKCDLIVTSVSLAPGQPRQPLASLFIPSSLLVVDAPQRERKPHAARAKGDPVRAGVAGLAVLADPVAIGGDEGV